MRIYYIYIITNIHRSVLYTGVTNNIIRRVQEHRTKINKKSFSKHYNLSILVYYETYTDIRIAIMREKQIKAGSRKAKIKLVESINPLWKDLYSSIL